MARIITAIIETEGDNAGEVSIDLAGYQGTGCHAVQEAFTKGLGGDVLLDQRKPEYNAVVKRTNCINR